MKSLIIFIALYAISISFNAQSKDLSGCAQVSKEIGTACGGSSASMNLKINNQCGIAVHANVCFETLNGEWDCESDTIYKDENNDLAYIFSNCKTTGKYKLELCSKVKGKLECESDNKLDNNNKPKKNDPCKLLVQYRDNKLVKGVDKQFRILDGLNKNEELLTDLREELKDTSSFNNVIRKLDLSIRSLDILVSTILGYAPPGADIVHASGKLAAQLAVSYKKFEKINEFKKAMEGDVLEFASIAASSVTMKSQPIGYALKTKVTSLKLAKNIIETIKNDDLWRKEISKLSSSIVKIKQDINNLRDKIKKSKERLSVINETKEFIDSVCSKK